MPEKKPKSKDEIVRKFIKWHFDTNEYLVEVLRFVVEDEDRLDEPIKLLEADTDTEAEDHIYIYRFKGKGEIPYPLLISVITPEEMQQVKEGKRLLPEGWDVRTAQSFYRDDFKPERRRAVRSKIGADLQDAAANS